jgi:tRNA A37 threonylcarbamoyladenosine dehydratase
MCGLTNVQKTYNQQNHNFFQFDQPELADHEWGSKKAVIKGTIAHITAIFGFTLAGLVIQDIYNSNNKVRSKL